MSALLPKEIIDCNFRRYKIDTDRFGQYLLDAATALGYVYCVSAPEKPTFIGHSTPPTTPERGNSRKKPKNVNAAPETPAKPRTFKYRLEIRDYTRLAQYIADRSAEIPQKVIEIGERAIKVRKEFTAWYSENVAPGDLGHGYFVGILESALQLLRPCAVSGHDAKPVVSKAQVNKSSKKAKSYSKSAPSGISQKQRIGLSNAFAALSKDEPDCDTERSSSNIHVKIPLKSPSKIPSKISRDPECVVTPETLSGDRLRNSPETSCLDTEDLFSFYVFFQDLARIREFLAGLWKDYRDKKIDLVTAAVTTNTAFEVLRDLQDELNLRLDEHSWINSYTQLQVELYRQACERCGERPKEPYRFHLQDHPKMQKVVDLLFLPALGNFREIEDHLEDLIRRPLVRLQTPTHRNCTCCEPGNPRYFQQIFGSYDPSVDRRSSDRGLQRSEDTFLLADLVFHSVRLMDPYSPAPLTDEITKEVGAMFEDGVASFLLLFIGQAYLDMHHILRDQCEIGLFAAQTSAWEASESLFRWWADRPPPPGDHEGAPEYNCAWCPDRDAEMEEILSFVDEWFLSDCFLPVQAVPSTRWQSKKLIPSELEPFYYMRRNIVFTGLLWFRLKMMMHKLGVEMADMWGSVLNMAHLYEACKVAGEDNDDLSWPDMEFAVDHLGKERLFRGRIPQSLKEAQKSLLLVRGASALEFASDFRERRVRNWYPQGLLKRDQKTGKREFSALFTLFQERLAVLGPEKETAVHLLERMLAGRQGTHGTNLQNQFKRSHRLTSHQLLQALRDSLFREQALLSFDFLRLHTVSLQIAELLWDTARDDIEDINDGLSPYQLSMDASGLTFECVITLLEIGAHQEQTSACKRKKCKCHEALEGQRRKIFLTPETCSRTSSWCGDAATAAYGSCASRCRRRPFGEHELSLPDSCVLGFTTLPSIISHL
ncbi:hypothetical protein HKX48_000683 [Thoreauomyces humboldtii]|nr:hypothetical protein HKX48_000683 [Thoreauomyces humboldtii]